MKLDDLAREAGEATRAAVLAKADVEASLARLHVVRRRRARTRWLAVAASSAAVVAVLFGASMSASPPAPEPQPAAPASPSTGDDSCTGSPMVRCLPGGVVEVDGPMPYSLRLTGDFNPDVAPGSTPASIDIFQDQPRTRAGVSVLGEVAAVGPDAGTMTAPELASWIASRHFVLASPVERTSVDGRPAWRVDVRLRPHERWAWADSCNGRQPECRALLAQDRPVGQWETGPWRGMVSRYVVVDARDGHPFVLWSWAFHLDARALTVNDQLVSTFRFD